MYKHWVIKKSTIDDVRAMCLSVKKNVFFSAFENVDLNRYCTMIEKFVLCNKPKLIFVTNDKDFLEIFLKIFWKQVH